MASEACARMLRLLKRRRPAAMLSSDTFVPPDDVEVAHHGGATVIAPKRDLTGATATRLGKVVAHFVPGDGCRIVLDLINVHYVDSTGLSVVVDAMKRARAHGGDVCVTGLQPDVRAIFELTRLVTVFSVHVSREEALAACA